MVLAGGSGSGLLRLVCLSLLIALWLGAARAEAASVVFSGDRCDASCHRSVWVISDDGTGLRRLTSGPVGEGRDDTPSWSPDGRTVAFVRSSYGPGPPEPAGVFTIGSDGRDERPVASTRFASAPDWSPDGGSIVFSATVVDGVKGPPSGPSFPDSDIFLASAAGGVRRLTLTPRDENITRFADDGRVIFFRTRYPTGVRPDLPEGWYSVDPSTGEERLLTVGDADYVSFSPDGTRIAAVVDARLFVMRSDGGQVQLVTPNREHALRRISWTADSSALFFSASDGLRGSSAGALLIHRFEPGRAAPPRPVTSPPGFDSDPDWTDGSGTLTGSPDRRPPAFLLTDAVGRPLEAAAARTRRSRRPRPRSLSRRKSRLLVLDPSGIRRVEIAVARQVGTGRSRRCRFLRPAAMTPARSCRRLAFLRVRSSADWRRHLKRLKRKSYLIAFRSSDRLNNRSRPKLRAFRVR